MVKAELEVEGKEGVSILQRGRLDLGIIIMGLVIAQIILVMTAGSLTSL